jgi:CRP-like cAMP-binding protein
VQDVLANQIFGLNGLVNLSNLIFLLAFSIRDVLQLRILSVVSYLIILPYYYLQQQPLWLPVFWGIAFIVINGLRIVLLLLERRPVKLNDDEAELYKLVFTSIDQRDFLKLATLARWADYPAGAMLIERGECPTQAMVMISGAIEARFGEHDQVPIHPGQLIGTEFAFSGLPSPADIVVTSPARIVAWDLALVRRFLEPRPELRARLLKITSEDLVGKVNQLLAVRKPVV